MFAQKLNIIIITVLIIYRSRINHGKGASDIFYDYIKNVLLLKQTKRNMLIFCGRYSCLIVLAPLFAASSSLIWRSDLEQLQNITIGDLRGADRNLVGTL